MGPINANQSLNFNKNQSEHYLSNQFTALFGNQTQRVIQILENLYIDPGVADDDHVAWLQYCATVSNLSSSMPIPICSYSYTYTHTYTHTYIYTFIYTMHIPILIHISIPLFISIPMPISLPLSMPIPL